MMYTFASVDARYGEAAVMLQVSQAERWVNEQCGQSFSGTIPDGVEFATIEIAKYFMEKQMLDDRHLKELTSNFNSIVEICKVPLAKHKLDPNYSSDSSEFHLPTMEG